ncbi:hypothetical protein HER32_12490 [Hymenobacter sp. BT18]|uniref:hypothetical protein n=1 Tax=Hymenobacter sp. BT18 TaxID=2835648 RepID=UPI00143E4417|nr:hypothetical protein [Hymenobacter sp. BT18]QIX61959.1 hypothetical protein HER32_12490 [Hymenobacter sp. BT18]
MLRFLRNLLLLGLLLYGSLYLLNARYGEAVVHPLAGYIMGYFALLTGIIYWVTARLVKANPENFMAAYFGSMVLRMFLSIGIVLVYLYRGGAHEGRGTYTFLGAFFLGYFLFTGFEVWSVLTNLRPFSKPGEPTV